MQFSFIEIAYIVLGAVAGGFVSGLTGFGTALTAIPIWLQVLNPATATALATAASVTGQVQTLHLMRHAIVWRDVAPFVIAGLLGIPLGVWALPSVDTPTFKLVVGMVMVAYCGFSLVMSLRPAPPLTQAVRKFGDDDPATLRPIGAGGMAVAFVGGVMSGLAGLSAPVPIVWMSFQPWSRDRKRALLQVFNTAILSATFVSLIVAGLVGGKFWLAFLIAVPGTLAGVHLGSALYRRLDDHRFDRLVLALLMLMGLTLIIGQLHGRS